MRLHQSIQLLHHWNHTTILLPFFVLFFIIIFSLFIVTIYPQHQPLPKTYGVNLNTTETKRCNNIFSGEWIPYSKGPYYNNETCNFILDQQNCFKFGRPDREFLYWRWKPHGCDELPLFDATLFLEIVKGKSMAFVGDSVARNQIISLLCLLNNVAEPEDISNRYATDALYFKRWFYADYNFTLVTLWSPFLVRTSDVNSKNLMNLHLDEADEAWANEVENFHFVIISPGQWFFRPLMFYEDDQIVGCHQCGHKKIKDLAHYYGYRMAFRTAFRTLLNLKGYKGITFLRTFSPSHFERTRGGKCDRTKPYTKEEMNLDGYVLWTYKTQVEEFIEAEKEAKKKGLKFFMLNTTEIMLMRTDGHPNNYVKNSMLLDCVHWCLPGPIE